MKTLRMTSGSLSAAIALGAMLTLSSALSAQSGKAVAPATASVAASAPAPRPGTVSAEAEGTMGPNSSPVKAKPLAPTQVTVDREVFAYETAGRRDPYKSLMTTNDIRPLLSDLRVTAIAYDPDGGNSVAILREIATKVQHRVKVGQQIGRMRVANIRPKQVVFTIEEFGLNRQETLQVSSDSTKARTP